MDSQWHGAAAGDKHKLAVLAALAGEVIHGSSAGWDFSFPAISSQRQEPPT
jgi:hypothetical protein